MSGDYLPVFPAHGSVSEVGVYPSLVTGKSHLTPWKGETGLVRPGPAVPCPQARRWSTESLSQPRIVTSSKQVCASASQLLAEPSPHLAHLLQVLRCRHRQAHPPQRDQESQASAQKQHKVRWRRGRRGRGSTLRTRAEEWRRTSPTQDRGQNMQSSLDAP